MPEVIAVSRQSVYEGLKTAIKRWDLPYHHFEDECCTIAFASWEQYRPFDRALDSLPIPDTLRLNIYAERVAGRSDAVACTISDEVQRLGYMTSRLDMAHKLAAYEGLLSALLRNGVALLDYDYELFTVTLSLSDHARIESYLLDGSLVAEEHYVSYGQDTDQCTIHIEFAS